MARLALLALVAVAAACASVLAGGALLDPHSVFAALLHPQSSADVGTIVWQLRLPRILIGAVVGASLAVSGALLQGMLRNPLADPYLTGVSAGAAAAIAISIVAGISVTFVPAIGFASGLGTAVLVAALARRGSSVDPQRLILAGIALSALFGAVVTLVLATVNSVDYSAQIMGWLAGTLAGHGWADLRATMPYLAIALVLTLASVPSLDVLRVGDQRARAVGLDVDRSQWLILAASSLLASVSVALGGIVGFVGLVVPHVARRIAGSQARLLLPACVLLGAALCIAADAISRTIIAPAELPIGVLLAFIGVPSFLYLYLRGKRTA